MFFEGEVSNQVYILALGKLYVDNHRDHLGKEGGG